MAERYALFTDYKEQLRCELVDEGINCFERDIPARPEKRNVFGRVTRPARDAWTDMVYQFDDKIYPRDKYHFTAFAEPPATYQFNDKKRYMQDNRWGPVDVITFLTDLELGKALKNACDTMGKTH